MANLTGGERSRYVQNLFTRLAPRYDVMNRLMTAGLDLGWRREVIRQAALRPTDRLLDLGAGTGDLSFEAMRQQTGVRVVAADFTLEMMRVGRQRPGGATIPWLGADALQLPFADNTFDAVVSGFLMRNVSDVPQALREQRRVLVPGGRIVILDTTPPRRNWLSPAIQFYLHRVIPLLGRLIAGQAEAYTYLPQSTQSFLPAESLAAHLAEAGFRNVHFQRRNFGTIAIHWAVK